LGCDIHAVIEYENEFGFVTDFGKLSLSRDDKLFTFLALGEGGLVNELLFPPRGLPADCSLQIRLDFFVPADEAFENFLFEDEEFNIDDLEEWEKREYLENQLLRNIDFHSPSWLNFQELNQILNHYNFKTESLSADWQAAFSAMEKLSDKRGAENVRLVFWFEGAS
jgi:hypothetical protein